MIMLKGGCRRRRLTCVEQAEVEVDMTKLKILALLLVSFIFGCFVGAFVFSHIGCYTLLMAASVTGLMGVVYTCFREQLKRALKKTLVRKLEEEMGEVQDILNQAREVVLWRGTQDAIRRNRQQRLRSLRRW